MLLLMFQFTLIIMISDLKPAAHLACMPYASVFIVQCYRSNLQVSVYRLCELTVDTAPGYAVYVSTGNRTPLTLGRIILGSKVKLLFTYLFHSKSERITFKLRPRLFFSRFVYSCIKFLFAFPQWEPARRLSSGLLCRHLHPVCIH